MARNLKMSVDDARDDNSVIIPDVKNGNIAAASQVLNHFGIATNNHWSDSYAHGRPIWGTAARGTNSVVLSKNSFGKNAVPDVTGMGARDAVYLLESRGLRVKLQGRGKVKKQSYPAGKQAVKGSECVLILE